MITNPEYIKMVLALPNDFFEDWEWNYGDTFILKVASDKWIVHYIGDFELTNDDIGTWEPIGGCESTFEKVEEARRPVPSQEQLQTISELDWDLYYHYLVKKYSEYDTAEQAGLAMVMYIKYGKIWDGEKWIHQMNI